MERIVEEGKHHFLLGIYIYCVFWIFIFIFLRTLELDPKNSSKLLK